MRIAVVSPHARNNGNTTLAMLIGLELASQQRLTCITHAKPTSRSFQKYLNFRQFNDKTSTPSQIVKILKNGNLTSDDVRSYCKQVTSDLEAFTNEYDNFDQDDMNFMIRYIAKIFPHENIIFDVDDDNMTQNTEVIKLCDVVVLNITQSLKELDDFKNNKEKYLEMLSGKPTVVVVNKFMSEASNLKETAAWMGMSKPNNFTVVHFNPWITWATNHGKLNTLFRNIENKDPRVIELTSDLKNVCTTIAKAKSSYDRNRRTSK